MTKKTTQTSTIIKQKKGLKLVPGVIKSSNRRSRPNDTELTHSQRRYHPLASTLQIKVCRIAGGGPKVIELDSGKAIDFRDGGTDVASQIKVVDPSPSSAAVAVTPLSPALVSMQGFILLRTADRDVLLLRLMCWP
ncbi:hypothetical protein HNY73_004387 [Argiope bruennichi]|uniref:Uncharacterized protein n=1 Tax=Argiope bruennichi TaxID=94029 RepID=A0A8T0FNU1_ARGBR|nr:hypothetical protein HNY73_004387 [Argiope bruennichi]